MASASATVSPGPSSTPPDQQAPVVFFTVNSSGDGSDVRAGDGRCEDGQRNCTLRAAIEEVNAVRAAGYYNIAFSQPYVINVPVGRPLPSLRRDQVRINGNEASAPEGAPCQPGTTVNGPGGQTVMVGLTLGPVRGVVVQGLVIKGFGVGVSIADAATDNRIGSDGDGFRDALECNVITANRDAQVQISGEGTTGNWISGNFLGIDAAGVPGSSVSRGIGVAIVDRASGNAIGVRRGAEQAIEGLGNRIQGRHFVGVLVLNEGTNGNQIAGNLIGAGSLGDLGRHANQVGILVGDSAAGTRIGSAGDGAPEPAEANLIQLNLLDGISIDNTATGSVIRANSIRANLRDGLRLATTRDGRQMLGANAITGNGGAAIAVDPQGPQAQPPEITAVDAAAGTVSGTSCPVCRVDLFADPADEARLPLGTVTAAADGRWSLGSLDLDTTAATDANLTALSTDVSGNSSVLSAPAPLGAAWKLVDLPPPVPRQFRPGEPVWERSFRLLDAGGVPVAGAELRLAPLGQRFATGADGRVTLAVSVDEAARYDNRTISLSLEAVAHEGVARAVTWYPIWAIAREQSVFFSGDAALDLGGLGARGLGGILRLADPARSTSALRLDASLPLPMGLAQASPQGYGAALTAAPDGMREGKAAWQAGLARGGGIYELHAEGAALGGSFEVAAPVEAFNAGGPASGCADPAAGATVAGWAADEHAWLPLAGSAAGEPPIGATTFLASAPVSVDPATAPVSADPIEAPAALAGDVPALPRKLAASGAITLYTVGYDLARPVITPSLASGGSLSRWPAVLAVARDAASGVKAATGVAVSLEGQAVAGASYDPESGEIRFPEAARALPPGPSGAATIEIAVTDGFCNTEALRLEVILDRGGSGTVAPTPTRATPTPTPTPIGPTATRTATPGPGTPGQPTATPSRAPATGTPPATATGETTPAATAGSSTPGGATPPRPNRTLYLPWTNQRRG